MALGRFISINGEQVPNPAPGSFSMGLNPQENLYTSESGLQMSNVVRLDRPSWGATFDVSSKWRDKFLTWCKLASVTCVIDGETMSGRLRLSGAYTLVENSENTQGTQGLWEVPITFEGE